MKFWGIFLLSLVLTACDQPQAVHQIASGQDLLEFMQPVAGFQQPAALEPDTTSLHAAHPAQRIDIWTATLWLQDETGEAYSSQLTMLRLALRPARPDEQGPQQGLAQSLWATQALYSARLSLNSGRQHSHTERLSRAALGLAGASEQGVWLEQWRMLLPQDKTGTFELYAVGDDFTLSLRGLNQAVPKPQPLTLVPGLPASPVGYVQTPLPVSGEIEQTGTSRAVNGQVWFDHFWGNGLPLGRGQLGVVHVRALLSNGLALQCLQLRRRNGGGTPIGGCTVFALPGFTSVVPTGSLSLDRRKVQLNPTTKAGHLPVQWLLESSEPALSLRIQAAHTGADSNSIISRPARVEGIYAGTPVTGQAWLELSGWSEPLES